MANISRKQVFESLTACVTPESADYLFQTALQSTGLADKASYSPDEVLALSQAMLDLAMNMARDAEGQAIRDELFG